MKSSIFYYLFVIVLVQFSLPSISSSNQSTNNNASFEICQDAELGISFACSPDWQVQLVNNGILIIISDQPDVTLIIAKINSNFKFLGQVTNDVLKDMKHYDSGFKKTIKHLNNRDVIEVKALSKKYPDRRLSDFYLLHKENLFGILFSVTPKEKYAQYNELIKTVVESVKFEGEPEREDLAKE